MAAQTSARGLEILFSLGVTVSHDTTQEDAAEHAILNFFVSHIDPTKTPQRLMTPRAKDSGHLESPRGFATEKRRKRLTELEVPCTSSPLVLAAAAGRVDCVHMILDHSPVMPSQLWLPISVASARAHLDVLAELLQRLGPRSVRDGVRGAPESSPLILVAALGQLQSVACLLRHPTEATVSAQHELIVAAYWCLRAFAAPLAGEGLFDRRATIADRICRMLFAKTGRDAIDPGEFPELLDALAVAISKRFWEMSALLVSKLMRVSPEQDVAILAALPTKVPHPPVIGGEGVPGSLEFVQAVIARFGVCQESVALASNAWDARGVEFCIRSDVTNVNPLSWLRGITSDSCVHLHSPRKQPLHRSRTFYHPVLDAPSSGMFAALPSSVLGIILSFLSQEDKGNVRHCCKHLAYGSSWTGSAAVEGVISSFFAVNTRSKNVVLSSIVTGDTALLDLLIWRDGGRKRFVDSKVEDVFPLLAAASLAQVGCTSLLLCRGAHPNGPEGSAVPPLHAALFLLGLATASEDAAVATIVGQRQSIAERATRIASELIAAGADLSKRVRISDISAAVERCRKTRCPRALDGTAPELFVSPLALACYAKSEPLVKLLIQHDAPPETVSDDALIAMHALLSPVGMTPKLEVGAGIDAIGQLLLGTFSSVSK
jgi:hypothetical protein